MEFLLLTLMFLAGWFVCWIQMSQSESRELRRVRLQYQQLQSENLKAQLKSLGLTKAYESLAEKALQAQKLLKSPQQSEYPLAEGTEKEWDLEWELAQEKYR